MTDKFDQAWRDAEFGAVVRVQARKHGVVIVKVAADGTAEIHGPRSIRRRRILWTLAWVAVGLALGAWIGGASCAS